MTDTTFPYGFDDTMSLQQMAQALREVQGTVLCDWCEEECDGHRFKYGPGGVKLYKCDECAAKDREEV